MYSSADRGAGRAQEVEGRGRDLQEDGHSVAGEGEGNGGRGAAQPQRRARKHGEGLREPAESAGPAGELPGQVPAPVSASVPSQPHE